MNRAFAELKHRLAEVWDLRVASWLLEWDQEVTMPRGGAAVRPEQLATLERVAHERFTAAEIGRLLDELQPYEERLDPDSDEASLIRVARRDWEKARRVPAELRGDLMHAAATGYEVWVQARERSDFALFLPTLQRNLELKHRYIECFDGLETPYDALLDDYEEGMTTAEVTEVLMHLRDGLVPLMAEIAHHGDPVDASFLAGPFPVDRQRRVERAILDRVGFDEESWRLDEIVHPAAYAFATSDVRISTRYSESSLETLFSVLHEFGHGLYERQVSPALERTPLASGVSLGVHEAQSRLWENVVGRGLPFWRHFYPLLQEEFPERLGDVSLNAFYRAVNRVAPSLIRVDADEVTYNLHVILRFELERELFDGGVEPRELPEAWNGRISHYLGIDVPDDARGVLQDSHWSGGGFGYFPTYSLGNVLSVQLWERLRGDVPGLDDEIERGEFGSLRDWLREHVHRHGRKFTPRETVARAAGRALDPEPYLGYLREKFAEIYGLSARR
ncbi:MAG: carboxypeptidase M32 [Actinomycetota bacterium]|nr:carboxypeptidase M32 [Actinomycetota bacterium]